MRPSLTLVGAGDGGVKGRDPSGAALAAAIAAPGASFGTASSKLRASAKAELRKFVDALKAIETPVALEALQSFSGQG